MFGQGYIKVISAAAEFGGRSLEMPIKWQYGDCGEEGSAPYAPLMAKVGKGKRGFLILKSKESFNK
jgi:hypothetical protein